MTAELGKHLGAWKNAENYDYLFCAWHDGTHKLLKILARKQKSVILETPHGGVLEVTNAKALYLPDGDGYKIKDTK